MQNRLPRVRNEVSVRHRDPLFDICKNIVLSFSNIHRNKLNESSKRMTKDSIPFSCHVGQWMWSSNSPSATENKMYLNTFSQGVGPCLQATQHTSWGHCSHRL